MPKCLLKSIIQTLLQAVVGKSALPFNHTQKLMAQNTRIRQVGIVYSIYRLLISGFFILTHKSFVQSRFVNEFNYTATSTTLTKLEPTILVLYACFAAVMCMFLLQSKKARQHTLLFGFLVDILLLSLFLYGNAISEIQAVLLFMVVIASSFIMLSIRASIAITAIAIGSLVVQQLYYIINDVQSLLNLSDALMLSVSLVAVGFLSWSISQRLMHAEEEALQNAAALKRLHAINQEVINNIVNGVVVIAPTGRVLMINHAALQLLRLKIYITDALSLAYLFEAERLLGTHYPKLCAWYQDETTRQNSYDIDLPQADELGNKIRINKKNLPDYGKLLIIEDVSREQAHAQQLKLASLGQLSASIAHEIRNPLGAISQAAQILIEDDADSKNKELHEMIFKQTVRVNRIIEDVMRLSRQETPTQELIYLNEWLPKFLSQHFEEHKIMVHFSGHMRLYFDPHHLEQVFINLIQNALRHTKSLPNEADVQIRSCGKEGEILIDILDNGDGVDKADIDNLFNPFFTKSQGGTGLGLYLSQAFSEANHARLRYLPYMEKTCFRLICVAAMDK